MAVTVWRKEGRVAVLEMCNGANLMNQTFADGMKQCLG
jgi:hypothetical protein